MLIIPSINLRKGKCVCLSQGSLKDEVVYSNEPISIAKLWKLKGAKKLQIIDIEGALTGETKNLDIALKIIKQVKIPVQFGGGIREYSQIKEIFDKDVDYVILGTAAFSSPELLEKAVEKYKNKIIVSIDSKDGFVAIKGWKEVTNKKAVAFAKEIEKIGIKTILYTDIRKNGMLKGPNFKGIKELANAVNMDVIVGGGISSLNDIEHLRALTKYGVKGVIIGKALYTGNIDLEKTIQYTQKPLVDRQRRKKLFKKRKKSKK